MSIKLIHFPMTRSLRVAWAINELGIDAEIDTRPFNRAALKEPEYRKLNPLGKTPVVFDNDKRMVESTAILEYLANVHANGKLTRKPGDADYAEYLQWLHFGEAGMGGYISQLLGHTMLLPEENRSPVMRAWAEAEMQNCCDYLEASLGDDGYLLGDFSLADISVAYPLFLLKISRNGKIMGEKTNAYFKRCTERDAFKAASALEPA